jgi:DNA modification methylase
MSPAQQNPTTWPADKVERRPLSSLIPYARNARTHSEAQVAQIAASMREWGWTNPVLVDEHGGVIAGHGRILAARQLGITEVPVMVARGWSEGQKRAYVLADNKLALNAGWDEDLLKVELADLSELGMDLELIGFSGDELAALMAETTEGLTDPDAVPDVPTEPVSVLGDVWVLGRHRLACGDSTTVEAVDKALNGVKPHLMVTDPPYGVKYDPNWRNEADRANGKAYRASAVGNVSNDDRADWSEAWALFPGDVAYVWHAPGGNSVVVGESLKTAGFELRMQIIWAKSRLVIGRGHYHCQHEPCWYAVKKGGTGHWSGSRQQTTLWSIEHRKSETGHGTQKPVECMMRPIDNNSSFGQAVYEPFSGSGTTIIAAEMTGRCCHAIELDPAYVDVAVRRWQEFCGKVATHADTGLTFAEMASDRGVVLPAGSVAGGPHGRVDPAVGSEPDAGASRSVLSAA